MSGPPRLRSLNISEAEPPTPKSVLGPDCNKRSPKEPRKPAIKPVVKSGKPAQGPEKKASPKSPRILNRKPSRHALLQFPMSASCSSDASSSDSSFSSVAKSSPRRKLCSLKAEKIGKVASGNGLISKVGSFAVMNSESEDCSDSKKRCAWITPNSEQCYIAFHDEEWGIPIHDERKLFEILSLSGALAELPWPAILNKRSIFRQVFTDFDPIAVSKLNEKKFTAPNSPASSLLSEVKLRAIVENARQICKVIEEFGSFEKYIWNFVNQKPIINQFRHPRHVPAKTPKAEFISKDMVRRGFRSVGPTVIYTFMQVAGLTNDHLATCFRFQECLAAAEGQNGPFKPKINEDSAVNTVEELLFNSN